MRNPSDQHQSHVVNNKKKRKSKSNNRGGSGSMTLKEFSEKVLENPSRYFPDGGASSLNQKKRNNSNNKKSSNYRRTRKRAENPKQTYVYATQRKAIQKHPQQQQQPTEGDLDSDTSALAATPSSSSSVVADLVRELNMAPPSTQHCDALVGERPRLMGQIRISEEENDNSSHAFAYLIDKPAGWAVLGQSLLTHEQRQADKKRDGNDRATTRENKSYVEPSTFQKEEKPNAGPSNKQRVKIVDDSDGSVDYLEYQEQDVWDLMTPEEIEAFLEDGGEIPDGVALAGRETKTSKTPVVVVAGPVSSPQFTLDDDREDDNDSISNNPTRLENWKRIQARAFQDKDPYQQAVFTSTPRPSVVRWLKEYQASENGKTLRGGNFWKALAGATSVEDSGLVLLCPKTAVQNLFCDSLDHVAVVGNGEHLAAVATTSSALPNDAEADIKMETLAKLKKARGDDVVETVKVSIPEQFSTCNDVVPIVQDEFADGIRGDSMAHPLERYARRRLIHCQAMRVSSLVCDDQLQVESQPPDDIRMLSGRRNQFTYSEGSFLGRSELRSSSLTTAYREINGAPDGFPGWTVDRYDKWLWVQHDPDYPRGPLPSIHDGNTAGVYYLEARQDRSSMGTGEAAAPHSGFSSCRPRLLEGQPAPAKLQVLENGVVYVVSLEKDLSTGIFLDQRPQRQWLAQNCGPSTRVLNCFAHTGAFSVAAATTGASTVSLDLSEKWLDRLPEHFAANGLELDERHDRIHGDCFDWLRRLVKRGETFDIVILDPPSTSVAVGHKSSKKKKRKRWSVLQDTPELVALAAQLVQPKGGLLWTTTNHAGLSAVKFARLCRKGLSEAANSNSVRLERVQPMPVDFPTIGPHTVKNLVWRFGL